MKPIRFFFAAVVALAASLSAFAADPSGEWSWKVNFNEQTFDAGGKMALKDGKLTGVLTTPMGDMPFSEGSFKDGIVAFTLIIDPDGNKIAIKYQGKLEDDTIVGKIDFPGFNGGEPMKIDWKAQRVKEEKKTAEPAKAK